MFIISVSVDSARVRLFPSVSALQTVEMLCLCFHLCQCYPPKKSFNCVSVRLHQRGEVAFLCVWCVTVPFRGERLGPFLVSVCGTLLLRDEVQCWTAGPSCFVHLSPQQRTHTVCVGVRLASSSLLSTEGTIRHFISSLHSGPRRSDK